MSAHTPGPWRWMSDRDVAWYATEPFAPIDPATFKATGYNGNPQLFGADGETVCAAGGGEYTPYKGPTPETAAANAALIAAAPALYAALETLAVWLVSPDMTATAEMRATAHAALALADGKDGAK